MSLKLHWFLPTTVDSRTVVPFGADGHRRAPTIDYLAQIARAADQLGFEGVLTPDGHVVRGRLARHRRAAARDAAAQVPRRVPPRLAVADARRAEGGDVPAHLRRSPAAQHRHRRRRRRAAPLRRLARPRRALRPHRRVPHRAARRVRATSRSTSRAATTTSRGPRRLKPVRRSRRCTSAGHPTAAEQVAAKHVDVYLTWGEPPEMVAPRLARHARAGRRAGSDAALRHPPPRDHPRPCEGRVGGDRALPRRARPERRDRRPRRRSPAASRSASSGWSRCTMTSGRGPTRQARGRRRTCGPATGWSAAAPARRWSAATTRSPTASRSTTRSASTSSSSPATRTSRRRTGSPRASSRSCARRGLLDNGPTELSSGVIKNVPIYSTASTGQATGR